MEVKETLNDAEEFVYRICKKSFLSLWSYANPRGKGSGKELCDILVVCEPDIIIFSVKDIKLTNSGDAAVDWERWRKRAVEASSKQIYGAERVIKAASHVVRKDGTLGLPLSNAVNWRIHRVAVAIGSQGKVPFEFGDFGKGFVHVFDEVSFEVILKELDTITDFVTYLADKENLNNTGVATLFDGAEEDLLALYLHNNRSFPSEADMLVVGDGLWKAFTRREEYRRKKQEDRESYIWDRLIEEMCAETAPGVQEPGPTLTEAEIAVRTMARENRFCRRVLGKQYRDFLQRAKEKQLASRIVPSLSDVVYVFLHVQHGQDRKQRESEIGLRCFIARGTFRDNKTVVGISTEEWKQGAGCHSYLCYFYIEDWTDKDQADMEAMKQELGYFKAPITGRIDEDEYPETGTSGVFGLPAPIRPRFPDAGKAKVGRNDPCPCGSGQKYKRCHGR